MESRSAVQTSNRAPLLLALQPSRAHQAPMTGCRAQVESTGCRSSSSSPPKRATKCRAFAQCSIRFQWADRVERKQLGIADGLQWKADQRFKRPTGHHCSWHSHRVEPTERGCTGCRAQVESTGCRAQVESTGCRARVESTKNVVPPPISGSNGLIEWSANSSESQTGSSTDLSVGLRPVLNRVPKGRLESGAQADRLHRQAPALTRAARRLMANTLTWGATSSSGPGYSDRTQPLGRTA